VFVPEKSRHTEVRVRELVLQRESIVYCLLVSRVLALWQQSAFGPDTDALQ
jgi:hypothetical protein